MILIMNSTFLDTSCFPEIQISYSDNKIHFFENAGYVDSNKFSLPAEIILNGGLETKLGYYEWWQGKIVLVLDGTKYKISSNDLLNCLDINYFKLNGDQKKENEFKDLLKNKLHNKINKDIHQHFEKFKNIKFIRNSIEFESYFQGIPEVERPFIAQFIINYFDSIDNFKTLENTLKNLNSKNSSIISAFTSLSPKCVIKDNLENQTIDPLYSIFNSIFYKPEQFEDINFHVPDLPLYRIEDFLDALNETKSITFKNILIPLIELALLFCIGDEKKRENLFFDLVESIKKMAAKWQIAKQDSQSFCIINQTCEKTLFYNSYISMKKIIYTTSLIAECKVNFSKDLEGLVIPKKLDNIEPVSLKNFQTFKMLNPSISDWPEEMIFTIFNILNLDLQFNKQPLLNLTQDQINSRIQDDKSVLEGLSKLGWLKTIFQSKILFSKALSLTKYLFSPIDQVQNLNTYLKVNPGNEFIINGIKIEELPSRLEFTESLNECISKFLETILKGIIEKHDLGEIDLKLIFNLIPVYKDYIDTEISYLKELKKNPNSNDCTNNFDLLQKKHMELIMECVRILQNWIGVEKPNKNTHFFLQRIDAILANIRQNPLKKEHVIINWLSQCFMQK